jgi:hypothetical protein
MLRRVRVVRDDFPDVSMRPSTIPVTRASACGSAAEGSLSSAMRCPPCEGMQGETGTPAARSHNHAVSQRIGQCFRPQSAGVTMKASKYTWLSALDQSPMRPETGSGSVCSR